MFIFDKKRKKLYTREDTRGLRAQFWTTFGQYMRAVPSAEEGRVSWLNYKTGIKYLYFRMDVENNAARISVEVRHPDDEIRGLIYAQFLELKPVFDGLVGIDWRWAARLQIENRSISCIQAELPNVTFFRKEDWPEIISFFKPRIIALDQFWALAKHHFDVFR